MDRAIARAQAAAPRARRLTDQAALQRLLGAEQRTIQAPAQRLRQPHQARQEPGAAGLRHQAAAGEDEAELRGVGGDADIHGQRQGEAHAHGCAVEGGDRRLAAPEHRPDHP
jgi:hypothetical protein